MRNAVPFWLLVALTCAVAKAEVHRGVVPPTAVQVRAELSPQAGVADLKFRDFFAMPIGPKGLAPSARLLGLEGQRVRVVGYMARQDVPSSGIVILAPLPVTLGDEDESFSDDLPAAALYVHLAESERSQGLPWMPGLLSFTGVLQLGAMSEVDGRMSFVRLQLDPELSHAVVLAR